MDSTILLEIDLTDSGEKADLDALTRQLLAELRNLNVDKVRLKATADRPSGTKAGEAVTIGALAIVVLPAILPELVSFLKDWCLRKPDRSIKITHRTRDNEIHAEFDLDGVSKQDLDAVIRAITRDMK